MTTRSIRLHTGARFVAHLHDPDSHADLLVPDILRIQFADAAALDSMIQAGIDARNCLLASWAADRIRAKYPHLVISPLPVGLP